MSSPPPTERVGNLRQMKHLQNQLSINGNKRLQSDFHENHRNLIESFLEELGELIQLKNTAINRELERLLAFQES